MRHWITSFWLVEHDPKVVPFRPAPAPHDSTVVVAAAEPDLFIGAFERDRVVYAAPAQIAIDAISVGGDAADRAREEIRTW